MVTNEGGDILYSCPKAKRDAFTALLSLLTWCYVSINVLESSSVVEVSCMWDHFLVGEEFGQGE